MAKMNRAGSEVSIDGSAEYEPMSIAPQVVSRTVETRTTLTFTTLDQTADDIAGDIERGSLFQFSTHAIEAVRITERKVIVMRKMVRC